MNLRDGELARNFLVPSLPIRVPSSSSPSFLARFPSSQFLPSSSSSSSSSSSCCQEAAPQVMTIAVTSSSSSSSFPRSTTTLVETSQQQPPPPPSSSPLKEIRKKRTCESKCLLHSPTPLPLSRARVRAVRAYTACLVAKVTPVRLRYNLIIICLAGKRRRYFASLRS